MTAGHFGLATGVKAFAPRVPLWAIMVATYLLDIAFVFFVSAGLESLAPIHPGHPAYGEAIIQATYTHSLLGAALIALVAGAAAAAAWGRSAGGVIGAVVFSHWLLDLVVHRRDLAVVPGDVISLPLFGLGLWDDPLASAAFELVLVLSGTWLYHRSAARSVGGGDRTGRVFVSAGVIGAILVLLLGADVFGLPLVVAVGLMLLAIVLGGVLDARLDWRAHGRA